MCVITPWICGFGIQKYPCELYSSRPEDENRVFSPLNRKSSPTRSCVPASRRLNPALFRGPAEHQTVLSLE